MMNSSTNPYPRFEFGQNFGVKPKSGIVSAPVKHSYKPQEVEEIRIKAFEDGLNRAEESLVKAQSLALDSLTMAVHESLRQLDSLLEENRQNSLKLCLAMARKLAGTTLERDPNLPLEEALASLSLELKRQPNLWIAHQGISDEAQMNIKQNLRDKGFKGAIHWQLRPHEPKAWFEIEWGEGRARFDPERIIDEIVKALGLDNTELNSSNQDHDNE
jgi:flagellar assembly protein FliH